MKRSRLKIVLLWLFDSLAAGPWYRLLDFVDDLRLWWAIQRLPDDPLVGRDPAADPEGDFYPSISEIVNHDAGFPTFPPPFQSESNPHAYPY